MIEFYLIQRNLISFLKRTISFSIVWARTFDRARTITRTFDRGVVRRQNSDLKLCRRIFYYRVEFFIMQLEKNVDEFFISGVEKNDDEFISGEGKNKMIFLR